MTGNLQYTSFPEDLPVKPVVVDLCIGSRCVRVLWRGHEVVCIFVI